MAISPLTVLGSATIGSLTLRAISRIGTSFAEVLHNRQGGDSGEAAPPTVNGESLLPPVVNPTIAPAEQLQHEESVAITRLQRLIEKRFSEYSIDTSKNLELEIDETGAVRVLHGHPQQAQIKRLLAEDSALNELFQRVFDIHRALQRRPPIGDIGQFVDNNRALDSSVRMSPSSGRMAGRLRVAIENNDVRVALFG